MGFSCIMKLGGKCMLELKNVTKVYRSKKGNKTVALDNVSLTFGETGMVFVLGKSGSGKSTLLNVLGGLDKYDQGEIIIQGKSSRDFKNQDFDSYRNTYIGFVFQEFNILEDYTVYRNVALALQLQKRDVSRQKVETILEKLDLKGFEHRKPNELSGGQKQRVAIARALIKDPDIIMADEPTGALDSTTGAQVFDVLKEISKEKLVIVVSHDREAAEKYADRIVEFQDGKVIRDSGVSEEMKPTKGFELIKSKLPWKESFKLGFGSLNHKKIRLAFTILLAAAALIFLGLSDTMSSFELGNAQAKLVSETKEGTLLLQHLERYDEWNSISKSFRKEDLAEVEKQNDILKRPVYKIQYQDERISLSSLGLRRTVSDDSSAYYPDGYMDLYFVSLDNYKVNEKVRGKLPTANDELLISNYIADAIIESGIEYEGSDGLTKLYQPKSYEDLLSSNQILDLGSLKKVRIVGIIDYDLSLYAELKTKTMNKLSKKEFRLRDQLRRKIDFIYNQIFVTPEFLDSLNAKVNNYASDGSMYYIKMDGERRFSQLAFLNEEIEYYDGTTWKKINQLEKNQILLSKEQLTSLNSTSSYEEQLEQYLKKNPNGTEDLFLENLIKNADIIGKTVELDVYNGYTYNLDRPVEKYESLQVIGVYRSKRTRYISYVAEEIAKPYVNPTVSVNSLLIETTDRKTLEKLFADYPYDGEYSLKSIYSSDIEGLASSIKVIKKVAFYASLVFFVFAIFLIMNFIFTSISYRKKEIGILRAIGARNIDVLKIFLWEGLVLALISGVIAIVGTFAISAFLNSFIQSNLNLVITPMMVSIRQVGLILITVFAIVLIASILPIFKIARMKPMDAILNK